MDGISVNGEVLGAVNIAMLRKTQDLAQAQVLQMVQSLPQSPSAAGVGVNIDVTG